MLSPKQGQRIDPSWRLEKRLWWALEAISGQCDGARKLDGVGFSKYDRPIADRLQGLHTDQWKNGDIDDGIHLIRKYRKQLENMSVSIDDIVGDMAMVGELPSTGVVPVVTSQVAKPAAKPPVKPPVMTVIKPLPTPIKVEPVKAPVKVNVSLEEVSGGGADLYTEFLTGAAGTGKTYEIRQRIAADPNYALLTATTGIAAINLGTITLNSALGYFDTDSLEESMIKGYLEKRLREIIEQGYKNIVIDELSMMDKRQLDMIYEGIRRVNERSEWHGTDKLGLILTGDFCQLPPIANKGSKAGPPWAFNADCWSKFEGNTIRLTKCWRQSDEKFLSAINLIRNGNGRDGVRILRDIGIVFSNESDKSFDGTTIIAKNDAVDGFNFVAHSRVSGQMVKVNSTRWGKLRKEWDVIPAELSLKLGEIGSYVMIYVNDSPHFTYVNGDCGHVKDFSTESVDMKPRFTIELKRNNIQVVIGLLTRFNYQKDAPRELGEDNRALKSAYAYDPEDNDQPVPSSVAFDIKARKWIVGGITYYPLRLAYASTVHKSQGLTLDNVQIDCNNHFFGSPAMAYVALSRARTPEGLRIVGTPETLIDKVKVHPEVIKWL